jgi:membrane protease subunit HflK
MPNPFLQLLISVFRPSVRKMAFLYCAALRTISNAMSNTAPLSADQQLGMHSNRNNPPDLDELWRQFTQRLSALLARDPRQKIKKTFGVRPPPKPSARHITYGILGAVCAALGFWISSGFYNVSSDEAAVLFGWGRYQETVTTPGIHWRLPYPIQSNENIRLSDNRIIKVESSEPLSEASADTSLLLQTQDTVGIRATVQYKIQDAAAFLLNNTAPETTLIQITQTALRALLIKNKTDNTLPDRLPALAPILAKTVQSQLDNNQTGIHISHIALEDLRLPDTLQGQLEEDAKKILEERDRQKNRIQREAEQLLAQTRMSIVQLQEQAYHRAWRSIAQAKADAEYFKRLLPVYAKAPTVVRDRLYRETFQDMYSKVPKVWANSVQAGEVNKKGLAGPLFSFSIQPPYKGMANASISSQTQEQTSVPSTNRVPSVFLGDASALKSTEQGIPQNDTNPFMGNMLFPSSKDALRERDRGA